MDDGCSDESNPATIQNLESIPESSQFRQNCAIVLPTSRPVDSPISYQFASSSSYGSNFSSCQTAIYQQQQELEMDNDTRDVAKEDDDDGTVTNVDPFASNGSDRTNSRVQTSAESEFMFYLHVRTIKYKIHKVSSFSPNYPPSNILLDKPTDINSCWSSDTNSSPQYILLRLAKPTIVTAIKFGKYEKSHFCNMKVFKVFGGLTEDGMVQLLDSGLKNDGVSQTFELKHKLNGSSGGYFLCRFIKIVPVLAWKSNFYHSIWYVELSGVSDDRFVIPALQLINDCRSREAVRLSLKHLRQKNYIDAFDSLQKHSGIMLEDSKISNFYRQFVVDADYRAAEEFIRNSCASGLFEEYVRNTVYKPFWRQLSSTSYVTPRMRGGHSMVIDSQEQVIYLFGGFDGFVELDDFWAFHIGEQRWELLESTFNPNNSFKRSLPPSARSCHQMCLDPIRKRIYILGRYIDAKQIGNNDFYMYDIAGRNWTLLSDSTEFEGGPSTIIDHQMCIDTQKNVIYVLGGRIQPPVSTQPDCQNISGFYSYDIDSNRWRLLSSYSNSPGSSSSTSVSSSPNLCRVSHAMLFDERYRKIYIFGGHRLDTYFSDMTIYEVDTDQLTTLKNGVPFSFEYFIQGYTLRATIDSEKQEIFAFTSLSICNEIENIETKGAYNIKNRFWVFDIVNSRWSCVYRHEKNNVTSNVTDLTNCTAAGIATVSAGYPDIGDEIFINLASSSNDSINFFPDPSVIEHSDIIVDPILDESPNLRFLPQGFIHSRSNSASGLPAGLLSASVNNNPSINVSSQASANRRNLLQRICDNNKPAQSQLCPQSPSTRSVLSDKPRARFAHQLVFDSINGTHYLFGGSADRNSSERLSDFWSLQLNRITSEDVLSKCIRLIRKEEFLYLSRKDKAAALKFFQSSLVNCYNVENHRSEILKLIKYLLSDQADPLSGRSLDGPLTAVSGVSNHRASPVRSPLSSLSSSSSSQSSSTNDPIPEQTSSSFGAYHFDPASATTSTSAACPQRYNRSQVFDRIMIYFPENMTQPKHYLEDFISDFTQFLPNFE